MKELLVAVGVVFVGFVGYKIIQKKSPGVLRNVKDSFSNAGQKVCSVLDEARDSFREGYAQA